MTQEATPTENVYPQLCDTRDMETTRATLMAKLMLIAVLAGCTGDDTSGLDERISDLEHSNMELQENLVTAQDENAQLQSALDQSVQDYSAVQVLLASAEVLSLIHI